MQKISPFLWFDDKAEEALNFYVSIFDNSKVTNVARGSDGKAISATAELDGLEVMALNAGPRFQFTEAISFFVKCEAQEEVDRLWKTLASGGEESMCGWVKDRYGLWWQIIPNALGEMLGDSDPERAGRVMQAMLQMQKIDVAGLQRAYDGS